MISYDQYLNEVPPAAIFDDRRAKPRSSIRLPMNFGVVSSGCVGQLGTGLVLNMSSTGIAFYTSARVQCGCYVNVWMPWLSDINLKAYGRIVRNSQEVTVVRVLRYEFYRQVSNRPPLNICSTITIDNSLPA